MKIEIIYNGSVAVCKVDGRPFNYCSKDIQIMCLDAFKVIKKHWEREFKDKEAEK